MAVATEMSTFLTLIRTKSRAEDFPRWKRPFLSVPGRFWRELTSIPRRLTARRRRGDVTPRTNKKTRGVANLLGGDLLGPL